VRSAEWRTGRVDRGDCSPRPPLQIRTCRITASGSLDHESGSLHLQPAICYSSRSALPAAGERTDGASAFLQIRRSTARSRVSSCPLQFGIHFVPAVDLRGRPTWTLSAIRRPAAGHRGQLVARRGEFRFTSHAQSAEPRSIGFEAREAGHKEKHYSSSRETSV
jgi:hypothetical protein